MTKFRKIVEDALVETDTLKHVLSQLGEIPERKNKEANVCIISANRSTRTPEENSKKQMELQRLVRQMGYGYRKTQGGYPEDGKNEPSTEPSLLIVDRYDDANKFVKRMVALGAKFDQETIFIKLKGENELSKYVVTTAYHDDGEDKQYNVGDTQSTFNKIDMADPKKDLYWTRLGKSPKKYSYFKYYNKADDVEESLEDNLMLSDEEIEKHAPYEYSRYGRNFKSYNEAYSAYCACQSLGLKNEDCAPSFAKKELI